MEKEKISANKYTKKNKMDILELKNSLTKLKNLVDVLSSKMEEDRRKNPLSCPIWMTERR